MQIYLYCKWKKEQKTVGTQKVFVVFHINEIKKRIIKENFTNCDFLTLYLYVSLNSVPAYSSSPMANILGKSEHYPERPITGENYTPL